MDPSKRRYRNRIEIIRDILEVLADDGGNNKTDIVYGAKINFNRLNTYLSTLINNDIVDKHGSSHTRYYITKKGKSLLNDIEYVISVI